MATINKILNNLTKEDVMEMRTKFLMGWTDIWVSSDKKFRRVGFNHMCEKYGLEPVTKEMADSYRLDYIRKNYTQDEIYDLIKEYMLNHKMDGMRWVGIELFNCRFGKEFCRLFKELLGSSIYRKLSEECRVKNLTDTQKKLYGGIGLAGKPTLMKAKKTVGNKKRKFLAEAVEEYKKTGTVLSKFNESSLFEVIVFSELLDYFDLDDIMIDYGLHPYDKRYPFSCDFYIKSIDLFIELNVYPSHGGHWFDENNVLDVNRKQDLELSEKRLAKNTLKVWCERDVEKRNKARESGINYLVFWDNSFLHRRKKSDRYIPVLSDFRMWLNDYRRDYESFIKDYPENTY